jgi:ABC-type amino acid transport substrate-binding protein
MPATGSASAPSLVGMVSAPRAASRPIPGRWRVVLLLVCAGLIVTVQEAGAADASSLRIGVSPVFPPMVFKQGKDLVGVEVELARGLAAALGREPSFIEVPWGDQIEALNAKRIDIIMSSMSITLPRRFVIEFSRPYWIVGQMTLVRREDKGQYLLGFPARPPVERPRPSPMPSIPSTPRVTLRVGGRR